MKSLETKKKSIYNLTSELMYQFAAIGFGIIIPRMFLLNLGSETNGLVSSVTQILTYVALVEAGIGAAALQALYKPINNNDRFEINGIISATRRFYDKVGGVYLSILLLLAFIFPFTVKTDISYFTIVFVVIVSGIPSVISYFFQARYVIFLNANGKAYISKNIITITFVATSALKIIFLYSGFGVVLVQGISIVGTFIQAFYIELYIRRHYNWLSTTDIPNFDSIKQSKNALIHQIAWIVTSNTDVVILTYFAGLKTVSVYTIYKLLLSVVDGIVNSILNTIHYILGKKYQESKEEYIKYFDIIEVLIVTLSFSLFLIARTLILPFLRIYTSGIEDINYIDNVLSYLFVIAHILVEARSPSWETISVAGNFKETQKVSVYEAVINLSFSLLLVKFMNIYGVLLGTILASTYRLVRMVEYSNKDILNRSTINTYRRYIINTILFLLLSFLINNFFGLSSLNDYYQIFAFAVVLIIIVVPLFLFTTLIFEKNVRSNLLYLIKNLRSEGN